VPSAQTELRTKVLKKCMRSGANLTLTDHGTLCTCTTAAAWQAAAAHQH
jgi:hypothetical protein